MDAPVILDVSTMENGYYASGELRGGAEDCGPEFDVVSGAEVVLRRKICC
jgi:hypothetical protein